MAIEKDLIIKFRIDRAQARRELQAHEQESKESLKNVSRAAKDTGESTLGAMDSLRGMLPAITAIGGATAVFGAVSQGVEQVAERVKALTADFIKQRDAMRELAGILGQKGDIKFAQSQYEFAGRVGMNVEDSTKYREAFQGVAQQYKGKFANEGEFNKYEEQSARYAASMGLSPDVAADLAGAMIRTMPKGGTSQDAMLAFGQSFHTMQQGSGSNKVLASQLREVTSSTVGPGMAFATPQEAAVAVRTMAESNPEEAATMLQRMRDSQLKLDDKEKAELGVDSKTPMLEMIRRVGAKAKEAQAKTGIGLDDYLMKYFPLAISRRGFQVGIQQGLGNNVIQKGIDDVNDIGAGGTESGVDEAFNDPSQAMMLRQSEAKRRAADAVAGQPGTLIAPYLENARAKMARANDDPVSGAIRGFNDMATYLPRKVMGFPSSQQQEEFRLATEEIEGNARSAGVDFKPSGTGDLFRNQQDLTRHLAELVELTRERNELAKRQAPAVPPPMNGKPNVPAQMPR